MGNLRFTFVDRTTARCRIGNEIRVSLWRESASWGWSIEFYVWGGGWFKVFRSDTPWSGWKNKPHSAGYYLFLAFNEIEEVLWGRILPDLLILQAAQREARIARVPQRLWVDSCRQRLQSLRYGERG